MTLLGLLAIGVCLRIAISDLYARRVPNAWLIAACVIATVVIVFGQFSAPRQPWLPHVAARRSACWRCCRSMPCAGWAPAT